MKEYHEITLNEFIGMKKGERKTELSNGILNNYIKTRNIQKKVIKAKKNYQKTEEYKEKLKEILASDAIYQQYLHRNITPELEQEYQKYLEVQKEKLRIEQEQERLKQEQERLKQAKQERRKKKVQEFDDWLRTFNLADQVDQETKRFGEELQMSLENILLTQNLSYNELTVRAEKPA